MATEDESLLLNILFSSWRGKTYWLTRRNLDACSIAHELIIEKDILIVHTPFLRYNAIEKRVATPLLNLLEDITMDTIQL